MTNSLPPVDLKKLKIDKWLGWLYERHTQTHIRHPYPIRTRIRSY